MKRKTEQRELHIRTGSLEELGRDFVDTWKKAEQSELPVTTQDEVIFLDIATVLRVLSSKRLELLGELQKHPGINTYELARHLGRHYKNVHSDVALFRAIGLIVDDEQKPGALRVPYSRIHAEIDLAAA